MIRKKLRSKSIFDCASYFALILALIVFLFPVYWIASISLKTHAQAISLPPVWFFKPISENYQYVFQEYNIGRYLWNSIVIGVSSVMLTLLLSIPAAYGLVRFKFKGRENLAFWILSIRILPSIAIALPIVLIMKTFALVDTYPALIIMHTIINIPFAVWLLMGFFQGIPWELEEASMVDGCTRFGALCRIILPIAMPGVVVTLLFCFLLSWNEFVFAVILTHYRAATLPVATVGLVGFGYITWGQIAAVAVVIIAPVIVVAVSIQRYLIRGLTFGAIKW